MKLFEVKAGDTVSLPIYENGQIAWGPNELGVKSSVDAKVSITND
jgi:hypothetical protein